MRFTKACALAALCLAFRLGAQRSAAPQPTALQPSELEPLVIDDGRHQGKVEVNLDLNSDGSVANATASGDDLAKAAIAYTKMFRHPNQSGASGLRQRVLFLRGQDVKTVAPVYPPIARAAHVSGVVRMVATVAPDGHVTDVTLISGPPMLINNARASLLQWTFPPIEQGGVPVMYHAVVDMNFAMQ